MPDQQSIPNPATISTRVGLIFNPICSPQNAESMKDQILTVLVEHGIEPDYYETSLSNSTTEMVTRAIECGAKLIIAAGGDGTIMEVANALVDTGIPLAIVPLGTGNLLAINLGVPLSINEALSIALSDNERWIDLIKINDGEWYFAIMGGIGFDARIMEDTHREPKQRFGRLAYIWTALQNLEGQLFDAKIRIDDGIEQSIQAKSILLANMGLLGPNINAFPEASPDSGTMEVGILSAEHAADFARLFAEAIVTGHPQRDPAFVVQSCRSITVELSTPQPFEFDGNTHGNISRLKADVVHKALCIRSL